MFACTDATDSVNRYTMAGSCGIAVQSFSHFYYTLVFFFSQPFTRSPVRVARHFNQCIDNDVHAKIKYINLNEGNKNSISWNWRWNGFLRVCSRVCVFKREREREGRSDAFVTVFHIGDSLPHFRFVSVYFWFFLCPRDLWCMQCVAIRIWIFSIEWISLCVHNISNYIELNTCTMQTQFQFLNVRENYT